MGRPSLSLPLDNRRVRPLENSQYKFAAIKTRRNDPLPAQGSPAFLELLRCTGFDKAGLIVVHSRSSRCACRTVRFFALEYFDMRRRFTDRAVAVSPFSASRITRPVNFPFGVF